LRRLVAAATTPAGDEDLRAAASAWRRERGLLSRDDTIAWLGARGIDIEQWHAHVVRLAAPVAAGTSAETPEVTPHALEALAVDLLCSGFFRRLGDRLVDCAVAESALAHIAASVEPIDANAAAATIAATAAGFDHNALQPFADRVAALRDSLERFAGTHIDDDALSRRLEERRLEWTRVVWRHAGFETAGAAREAAFMIDLDRRPVEEPVTLARADLEDCEGELGAISTELSRRLQVGRQRQVVGPWEESGVWHLVQVVTRAEPSLDDAALRQRARDEILTELLAPRRAERTISP
jgi:hypothetical protein